MAELPATTHMGRVDLSVAAHDAVLSFYTDVVGLEVIERGPVHADLGVGATRLLRLREEPDAPTRSASAAGLFHVALRVPERAALARAAIRLREAGSLTGASDHQVSEALYTRDPEGNGLEIYHDRPREQWEHTADGGIRLVTWPLDLDALAGTVTDGDTGLPPGTDVGHVHLEVTDLEAALSCYGDHLGFDTTFRAPGAGFLSAGGYHHHLGLNTWNGRTEPASGRGLIRFHVVVPESSTLDEVADRVRSSPWTVEREGDQLVIRDPDGIECRVTADE